MIWNLQIEFEQTGYLQMICYSNAIKNSSKNVENVYQRANEENTCTVAKKTVANVVLLFFSCDTSEKHFYSLRLPQGRNVNF